MPPAYAYDEWSRHIVSITGVLDYIGCIRYNVSRIVL